MEYIRNFLILFAIVVNSYTFCMEPHCMEPQGLSPYFIAQDSRISTVPLTGAFWEFLSEIPVVQYTSLKEGAVAQYSLMIVPQTLTNLPNDFKFTEEELEFHNLLHIGGMDSLFLTFINNLKSAGARYFVPYSFEDKIGTKFLRNQIGLISKTAAFPAELLGEQDTRQSELISSLRSILSFAEDLQRIHNKTYCITGINLVFSTVDAPKVMEEHFFTLPYVFVSDGMDQGIVTSMERFFLDYHGLDENPF